MDNGNYLHKFTKNFSSGTLVENKDFSIQTHTHTQRTRCLWAAEKQHFRTDQFFFWSYQANRVIYSSTRCEKLKTCYSVTESATGVFQQAGKSCNTELHGWWNFRTQVCQCHLSCIRAPRSIFRLVPQQFDVPWFLRTRLHLQHLQNSCPPQQKVQEFHQLWFPTKPSDYDCVEPCKRKILRPCNVQLNRLLKLAATM